MTQSPPPTDPTDRLLEHTYDGIQEYDNPLPRWWVAIFWLTILALPVYVVYYHFGPGQLKLERYDAAMVEFYDQQAKALLALGDVNDTMLAELESNESMMNNSKKVFQTKCAPCHGMFGEGGIGPNLTDSYWVHGGRMTDIYDTVVHGVPAKGMLAWEGKLKPAELMGVTAFVASLQGSEPPNAKEPQGDHVAPADMVIDEDAAPEPEVADQEGEPSDTPEAEAS